MRSPSARQRKEEAPKKPEKAEAEKQPEITLEQVRGVLADKSRSGKTAEVRAIIQKYGADRLSGIDPKDYPAVLAAEYRKIKADRTEFIRAKQNADVILHRQQEQRDEKTREK